MKTPQAQPSHLPATAPAPSKALARLASMMLLLAAGPAATAALAASGSTLLDAAGNPQPCDCAVQVAAADHAINKKAIHHPSPAPAPKQKAAPVPVPSPAPVPAPSTTRR